MGGRQDVMAVRNDAYAFVVAGEFADLQHFGQAAAPLRIRLNVAHQFFVEERLDV